VVDALADHTARLLGADATAAAPPPAGGKAGKGGGAAAGQAMPDLWAGPGGKAAGSQRCLELMHMVANVW
jgi:hypothetical protein